MSIELLFLYIFTIQFDVKRLVRSPKSSTYLNFCHLNLGLGPWPSCCWKILFLFYVHFLITSLRRRRLLEQMMMDVMHYWLQIKYKLSAVGNDLCDFSSNLLFPGWVNPYKNILLSIKIAYSNHLMHSNLVEIGWCNSSQHPL